VVPITTNDSKLTTNKPSNINVKAADSIPAKEVSTLSVSGLMITYKPVEKSSAYGSITVTEFIGKDTSPSVELSTSIASVIYEGIRNILPPPGYNFIEIYPCQFITMLFSKITAPVKSIYFHGMRNVDWTFDAYGNFRSLLCEPMQSCNKHDQKYVAKITTGLNEPA